MAGNEEKKKLVSEAYCFLNKKMESKEVWTSVAGNSGT